MWRPVLAIHDPIVMHSSVIRRIATCVVLLYSTYMGWFDEAPENVDVVVLG